MSLTLKFEQMIRQQDIFNSNDRVLLGLSGGVDSMVLFDLLENLPADLCPTLSVAHINHRLRQSSDQEELAIRKLLKDKRVPLFYKSWDREDHPRNGTEIAARKMRYDFYEKALKASRSNILLTAHHLDDHVETIIMRLVRGDFISSLTGIQLRQDFRGFELIRPLLQTYKSELYQYAKENNILYFEDETNAKNIYTRNFYRNVLIPRLESINPRVKDHFSQFSDELSDLLKIASPTINQAVEESLRSVEDYYILDLNVYMTYDHSLKNAVLHVILQQVYDSKKTLFKKNYIKVIGKWLAEGAVNSSLDLTGGVKLARSYDELFLYPNGIKKKSTTDQTVSISDMSKWYPLNDQHDQTLNKEWIGIFDPREAKKILKHQKDQHLYQSMIINKNLFKKPFMARHRQSGDKMRPAGMLGHKKIKDILIDEKIPKKDRDKMWIIADQTGKIVWLIGIKFSDFRNPTTISQLIDEGKSTDHVVIIYKKQRS